MADTPQTPYYAVIFTSELNDTDEEFYALNKRLLDVAGTIEGYIGYDSAREDIGISISYWKDLASIQKWKEKREHIMAKGKGIEKWYKSYKVRIAKVEREY